jgi:hypothetical protein
MQVTIGESVPDSIRALVDERTKIIKNLLPVWCNSLVIHWDDSDPDIASCQPMMEYRSVVITLHRAFLSDPEWEESMLHELAHAVIAPYTSLTELIVETYVPESAQSFVLGQLAKAEEATAEDLRILISKIRQ